MKDKFIKDFSKLLDIKKNFVILSHQNPDGDAVGSIMALKYFLLQENKSVTGILPDSFPDFLSWLDEDKSIYIYNKNKKQAIELINQAEVIICADFNRLDRIGGMQQAAENSKAIKVLIDHHLRINDNFDIAYSDIRTSSTAELIYNIISSIRGKSSFDKKIAQAIYVGIMTDTGSFNYQCFNSQTFNIVADLMSYGIDGDYIFDKVYYNYSENRMKLLGYALENIQTIHNSKASYIILNKDILKKYSHKKGDTEGFVNYPLAIANLVVSVIFIESAHEIKISFRSKGDIPVNEFARDYFNGGGHKNAAGGKSFDDLETTIINFEKYVKIFLEKYI
ncbi:MAG: DHH family phosphoesterase [Bacteroidetes bacterium HGW-Bacteroidetes-15]|nr:MAG: DHH family phosphoesterase [Bacteroidetes bacterium HGW-Bacteroidetes-15]